MLSAWFSPHEHSGAMENILNRSGCKAIPCDAKTTGRTSRPLELMVSKRNRASSIIAGAWVARIAVVRARAIRAKPQAGSDDKLAGVVWVWVVHWMLQSCFQRLLYTEIKLKCWYFCRGKTKLNALQFPVGDSYQSSTKSQQWGYIDVNHVSSWTPK